VIATINIVLLFWMLQKRIGRLDWKRYLAGSFVRIAPAAVAAGAAAHLAVTLLPQYVSDNVFLLVAAGAAAGGCVYMALCAIFGSREVKEIYALVSMKLMGVLRKLSGG
jgi:peptidoglycan biosynthesis protein MviN/MurJ (putative lipid II flippase)